MTREKQYASYKSLAPKEDKPKYTCMEIQDLQHRKNILTQNQIVCVYISGSWCEPCKTVTPKFAELAQQYNNQSRCMLVKENVDLELTRDFQITGIPAFIFYRGGELLRNQDGSPVAVIGGDLKQVQEILDKLLGQGN
jgi:thioredoxin 1